MAAVTNKMEALKFASKDLQNNNDIVMAAVNNMWIYIKSCIKIFINLLIMNYDYIFIILLNTI